VVNDSRIPYVWILNVLVVLGCLIAFMCLDGKELVLTFYIPLDAALMISRAAFYWYTYWTEKWEREVEEHEQQAIKRMSGMSRANERSKTINESHADEMIS